MNRNESIDYSKGICILLVFIGHSGIPTDNVSILWTGFYMSAFFMFSGYLFSYKGSTKQTVLHKVKTLFLFYLIWCFIAHSFFGLTSLLKHDFSAGDWTRKLIFIVFGIDQPDICSQLWFVCALFTTEIIWITVDNYSDSVRKRHIILVALAVFGIILNSLGYKKLPFRMGTAMIMLPIFEIGVSAKKPREKKYLNHLINMNMISFTLCLFIVIVTTFLNYIFLGCNVISLWRERFGLFPLFYINAVLGISLLINASKIMLGIKMTPVRSFNKFVLFFGKNSATEIATMNLVIFIISYVVSNIINIISEYDKMIPFITFFIVILLQKPISVILKNKHLRFLIFR